MSFKQLRACLRPFSISSHRPVIIRPGLKRLTPSRTQTTDAKQIPPQTQQFTAFWTTSRVLLFGTFSAAVAYVVGVNDAGPLKTKWTPARLPKPKYATPSEMQSAVTELRKALGDHDMISTEDDDLQRHGFSEWSSSNSDVLPVAVAYPRSTEDVSTIAQVCSRRKVPMVPFSGGSSLEGNFSAPFGGVSVDFAFMDRVVEFHPEDMDVVVQPAVPWMGLNEQIKDEGLFFPVDPGPSAQIGGMVGTSCSGTNAVRYGTMRHWVLSLTVVLPNGKVVRTRRRPLKSAAGYNLTQLFVGSEGTLGLVTEITLKLAPIPPETTVAVVTFPTIRDAAAAAAQVIRGGVPVSAVEIMDEVQMGVVNRGGVDTGRVWKECPTLFFKFAGTKEGIKENVAQVRALASKHSSQSFDFSRSPKDRDALWSARKNSLWSMLSLAQSTSPTTAVMGTDVAVPLSRLPDLIEATKQDLDSLGLFASALGHVGDGNFHTSIMYDKEKQGERLKVERIVKRMVERALEMGGTCSGEHGVGLGKKEALLKEVGGETLELMKIVKAAVDPGLVMNPGKIFDF